MYGSPALVFLLCSVADASMGFRSGRYRQPETEKQLQPQAIAAVNASKGVVQLARTNSSAAQKAEKADPCACEFKGECTCQNSLAFMDCISAACATGDCDCHEHQYHNACVDMANTCVSLEFQCSSQKAVCTMVTGASGTNMSEPEIHQQSTAQIKEELEDLIKKKCKLEQAEKDGWLNADNRLRDLMPEIEAHVKALKERKAEVPDINDCSPEEPKKPEAKEVKEAPKCNMKLLALSCALALTLAAADDQCAKHTVIPGDTCQRAAGAMKTTVGKVSKVLGNATFACSISQLFPGDVLVGCPTANYPPANCSWHTIGENETCASVAKAAGVGAGGVTEGGAPCPDAVYANDTVLVCPTPPAPPTPPPAPTPPPTPLPSGCSAHTVESGDTCQRVAGKLKTTVAHTMKRVSAAATVSCTKSALFPGDVLLGCPTPNYPPANCSWHAVDAGETCTAVANASGVAVANVTEGGMPCPGALFINDTLLVCH